MIRTILILLLGLFISTGAMAGHGYCKDCCKKCKKHAKHMCKVECRDHKKGGHHHWANLKHKHRKCCSSFSDDCDHHCGYCYEANRGYDTRRVDHGIAASYGTCMDRNCDYYGRKFDMDDDYGHHTAYKGDYDGGRNYKRKRTSYDYSYKARYDDSDHYDDDPDGGDVRRVDMRSRDHRGYAGRY